MMQQSSVAEAGQPPFLQEEFCLGPWQVRPRANEIRAASHGPGGSVWKVFGRRKKLTRRVEPKAMRVLLALAARPGEFVSKDQLIRQVWDGRAVCDDVLTRAVHQLRVALDDEPRNPKFIQTRNNAGYRLLETPVVPSRHHPIATVGALAAGVLLLATAAYFTWHRAQQTPSVEQQQLTLAVLPFMQLSSTDRNQYLSAAMTEALILNLARLPHVSVISRTSVMPYANHPAGAAEIARTLGADLLVEGSVQTDDETLRVVAQLIEPFEDGHLWAQQFDRPLVDVLALQQDLSRAIALQIGAVIAPEASPSISAPPGQVLPAAEMNDFLQARYLLAQEQVKAAEAAQQIFQRLAWRWPNFPPAWLGQAEAGLFLAKAKPNGQSALDTALEAAQTYETLAGPDSESHRCIGQILLLSQWDFPAAEARYRAAIAANPSDTVARRRYAWLLVAQQRYTEATREIHQVRLLDPLYFDNAGMATLLLYAGQVSEAVAEFERIEQARQPDKVELRTMGMAYLAAGEEEKAHLTFLRMLQQATSPLEAPFGQMAEIDTAGLYRLILASNSFRSPIVAAGFHNLLGEQELALAALNLAVEQRDPYVLYLGALPELASLRPHPQFQALLAEIGVNAEHIDYLENSRLASANISNPQQRNREN